MKRRLFLMCMSAMLLVVSPSALGAYTTIYTSPDWGSTGFAGVGDADNDGANEIVFSAWNRVAVYSYDGNSFNCDATWLLGNTVQAAFGVEVGDSDDDGRNEVLFGTWADTVKTYRHDGTNYAFQAAFPWTDYANWTVTIADTNGTAGNEILVGGRSGNFFGLRWDGSQYTRFYTSPPIGTPEPGEWIRTVSVRGVGNTNGNAQTDVVTYCDQGSVDIWEANGDDFANVFHTEFDNGPIGNRVERAATAYDTDGDGAVEVFYGDTFGSLHGLRYDGAQYVEFWSGSVGWRPADLAIGDVDRDGFLDLFVGGCDGELAAIRLEDGGIVDLGEYSAAVHPLVADVTGDGLPELVVACDDGHFYVVTPEPSALVLFCIGAMGLFVYARRSRAQRAKSTA